MKPRDYRCPECEETFTYAPSERTRREVEEMQLTLGKPAEIIVTCFHCPATLLVNPVSGSVSQFVGSPLRVEEVGSVMWDLQATEEMQDQVARLNEDGDRLNRAGATAKALEKFEAAIRIRKHDPQAWYNKGVILDKVGDAAGAIAALRHATRFDKGLKQGWNNLGFCLLVAGRLEEAEAAFDEGLRHNPDYPKLYLGKANCRVNYGDLSGACQLLRTALVKDPNYQPAKLMLQKLGC